MQTERAELDFQQGSSNKCATCSSLGTSSSERNFKMIRMNVLYSFKNGFCVEPATEACTRL
jgi:hypothetical protein